MRLSIIIPVLNEAASIERTLVHVSAAVDAATEIIVVDGGSSDETMAVVERFMGRHCLAIRLIASQRGRANQMNAGAASGTGDVLLFLHADTLLPPGAKRAILDGLANGDAAWGRFDVTIEGHARMLPVIAFCMNLRSRLTGVATGDQAMFVRRDAFAAAGRFPVQPLMEDIALSTRLKHCSGPLCLRDKVATSGRRWETNGIWRTILLMWTLRARYRLGASPEELKRAYR